MADEQSPEASAGDDWELIELPETPSSSLPPPPPPPNASDSTYSYYRHFEYGLGPRFCFKLSLNYSTSTTTTTSSGNKANHTPKLRGSYDTSSERLNTASTFNEQQQSRLFSLPTELRLKIYEDIFYFASPKVELYKACCPRHSRSSTPSVLAFLSTCQKARAEAELIFFSINNMSMHISRISAFCEQASLRRRESILTFVIEVTSGAQAFTAIENLPRMPNLRKLRIERLQSVRFLNVREWAVMNKQIKRALGNLPRLQELEIWTPQPKEPIDRLEQERAARLEQLDEQLKEGLPGAV